MYDIDDAAIATLARPCSSFILDAGLAITAYIPGCLLPPGTRHSPPIDTPALTLHAGHVLTRDAMGHHAALIDYHRRMLRIAAASGWSGAIGPYSCVEANLLLVPEGEHPVLIDMFGGAQREAGETLEQLADPATPPGVIYDNLDQGWALRILLDETDITTLEWDWDRPLDDQDVRVLRLQRSAVVQQATAAQSRLRQLHATLVRAIGIDLWNTPARIETRAT